MVDKNREEISARAAESCMKLLEEQGYTLTTCMEASIKMVLATAAIMGVTPKEFSELLDLIKENYREMLNAKDDKSN